MKHLMITALLGIALAGFAQKKVVSKPAINAAKPTFDTAMNAYFSSVKWRSIGPFRGGRSVTACGVPGNILHYYMGTTGGGVWKTEDAGNSWFNVSDGYFKTGSVGAVAVAESDPNVVYVGMGEHAVRGVMSSYGDGVYKSTDAGKTWTHLGLELTRQIAWIRIHPTNPDVAYVAAQGADYGATPHRGVYKTTDGGLSWKKTLFVDDSTGCADLAMDMTNPRILYAAMWHHGRTPWQVRSGGKGSGFYKSTDGGETWKKQGEGLPKELGKMSVSVTAANSEKVYVLAESDTEKDMGGLFVSQNGGETFSRVSRDHRLTQRAWYYIEVTADPNNENTVYVFNSPGLKSIDGGRTWTNLRGTHGDYHQLWINPKNSQNMIVANDGGAAVTFNGGRIWSTQGNQPTAQFYRVNADNLFPYNVYGGQQDNSSVKIASRNPTGYSIGEREWSYSAGGESAFLAFDPNNPKVVMGGSYQGTIEVLHADSKESKPMMVAPIQYQSLQPKDMQYRFNWNAPIICSKHEANTFYHAGNRLFKTTNLGTTWQPISPDLTRHDTATMGMSGVPYTNEGAGGENYATISYVAESPLEKGVFYTGSDDGLVYITKNGGASWQNITPAGLPTCLINSIEVSATAKGTVFIATTRYKFNDLTPALYRSTDYGTTWTNISNGLPYGAFTRVVRQDDEQPNLLYAGTETGFYVSFNGGNLWQQLQLDLPITPITDLKVHNGNLVASTMGRSFWILDELNVLRQYNPATRNNQYFALLQPTSQIRVSGGSGMNEAQAANKSLFSGVNAATGVVLHYHLPNDFPADSALTLTITDAQGNLVRTYSSKQDKNFESYPGGPDPDQVLPTKHGLNRFVWDTRYESLIGVPRVFIEGSYEGRKAAPGSYKAELRYGAQLRQVPITLLPHPALTATAAQYAEQQNWQAKVEGEFNAIHQSILDARKIKNQISNLVALVGEKPGMDTIKKQGNNLVKMLSDWEDKLVQNKAESNDDIINFVNMLSADYIFLKGEMDVNIPDVTDGQKQQYEALHRRWLGYQAEGTKLMVNELAAFNALCRLLKLEQIVMP
ncbi:MAG: glycosyl hydrolase [Bacteroidetes bacterium]|nr:MAG: glycosyl hydrolase [Bacteroidota bacterium]